MRVFLDRLRARNRRGQRGYSFIEVMIATIVASVGFAAVFSLQISTMLANISARDLAGAMNLSDRYVEVLQRDAFAWVGDDRPEPYLNQAPNRWHSFTEFPVDQNGLPHIEDDPEFGSALSRQRFCVHYWLSPMDGLYRQMMSVRVRVIWPRSASETERLDAVCPSERANNFSPDPANWYSVTIPTVIRSAQ